MITIPINGTNHILLDRRKFMGAAAGLIAAGILPKNVWALAKPYSFKQGAYDVTVVSDGTLMLPLGLFPDAAPAELKKLLGDAVQGENYQLETNPILLKSGSEVILLDTGGAGFQPSAGKVVQSLQAAGTEAAAVTKVIYTHAHPDHCWGTLGKDGKPIFSNASFHMAEAEWNFWTASDLASKMPKDLNAMVIGTQAQLAGIKERIKLFKPGTEILPGINVLDTAGHTPGHVSFEMAGGDGMIVVADAITNPFVFFAHPEWKFGFDTDSDKAVAARKKMLDMASAGKKKLLGYHWPYPGLGMAEVRNGAYTYIPMT